MSYYLQLEIMFIETFWEQFILPFDSHINCVNLIQGQKLNAMSRILVLQKRALKRIMNSQSRDSYSSLPFKSNHVLQL